MNTKYFFQFKDYDGESASCGIWVQNIVDAGTNFTSVLSDGNELYQALTAMTRGQLHSYGFTKRWAGSATPVTDKEAQREDKWLVVMQDTTETLGAGIFNPGYLKYFSFEVPTADRSLLGANSGEINYEDEDIQTDIIAELEANARSPWNNNAGAGVTPTQVVHKIIYVGRNL